MSLASRLTDLAVAIGADMKTKAPLVSPAFTGTPTIGGVNAETISGAQAKVDAAKPLLVLAVGAPVPAGTPINTVIVRTN